MPEPDQTPATIESISAVTLATGDMTRAIRFYRSLGFEMRHGGGDAALTSFAVGDAFLNLIAQPTGTARSPWGRIIFYVTDVDAFYRRTIELGLRPDGQPRDAAWGERYFHLTDPDGHELSFAKPLGRSDRVG